MTDKKDMMIEETIEKMIDEPKEEMIDEKIIGKNIEEMNIETSANLNTHLGVEIEIEIVMIVKSLRLLLDLEELSIEKEVQERSIEMIPWNAVLLSMTG